MWLFSSSTADGDDASSNAEIKNEMSTAMDESPQKSYSAMHDNTDLDSEMGETVTGTSCGSNNAMNTNECTINQPSTTSRIIKNSNTNVIRPDHNTASKKGVIYFRPIQPSDRNTIQTLHEQWFPVDYKSDFFDTLCNVNSNNTTDAGDNQQHQARRIMPGVNSIYCCVACFKELDDYEFEERSRREREREERRSGWSFWRRSDSSTFNDGLDTEHGDDCLLWEFDTYSMNDDGSGEAAAAAAATTENNNGIEEIASSMDDGAIHPTIQYQSSPRATIHQTNTNDQVIESGDSQLSLHHRNQKARMERFYTNGFQFEDDSQDTTSNNSNGIGKNQNDNKKHTKTAKQDDAEERIIGCIVGSFLPSDLPSNKHRSTLDERIGRDETASLLIPDCDTYATMFYIMTLGTCQEFRRCGLGSLLVDRVVGMIEQRKIDDTSSALRESLKKGSKGQGGLCGALYLHVITYNTGAMRLYERLGFMRVMEVKDYYTINSVNYDCYLYARYFHGNRGHQTTFDVLYGLASSIIRKLGAFIPTT